jgi:hypothetical protein
VLGADLGGRRRDQPSQRGDQFAGLVQVLEFLGIVLGGEAQLDRGGAHEVDGSGGDDLDRGDLGDVPDLLGNVALGVGRLVNV